MRKNVNECLELIHTNINEIHEINLRFTKLRDTVTQLSEESLRVEDHYRNLFRQLKTVYAAIKKEHETE